MNTSYLEVYVIKVCRNSIVAVSTLAERYGITAKVTHPVEVPGDVCLINGRIGDLLADVKSTYGEKVKIW